MTKDKFIKFSLESEENVNNLLAEFEFLDWTISWDDLKLIIINHPVTVIDICNILELFRNHKFKINSEIMDFLNFFGREKAKGFGNIQILAKYLILEN